MGFNLLKTLGGALGGFVTGGPAGALQGAVRSIVPPRRTTTVRQSGGLRGLVGGSTTTMVQEFGPSGIPSGTAMVPGQSCPQGFRLNKSTYVTRGGGTSRWPQQLMVHPKGEVCVRRRRVNPGNAKAATRAVRRLVSFYRLSQRVAKQLRRAASAARIGRGRGRKALPAGGGSVQVIDT